MVFDVTLSHAAEETIVVEYATADGTAAAGADYVAASGQLVFAPGETTHAVRVAVLNDQVVEETETFTLTVQVVQPQGAVPTGTPVPVPASASGTILDGDTAAVTVSEPVVGEVDGEAVFRITLAPEYAFGITLLYAAVDGTASAGTDYVATSGRLVFAPGDLASQVAVQVLDDEVAERVETFTLVLDPDAASGLGPRHGGGDDTRRRPGGAAGGGGEPHAVPAGALDRVRGGVGGRRTVRRQGRGIAATDPWGRCR